MSNASNPSAPKPRLNAHRTSPPAADRIFARMLEGQSYQAIAGAEAITPRRVRKIVQDALAKENVNPKSDFGPGADRKASKARCGWSSRNWRRANSTPSTGWSKCSANSTAIIRRPRSPPRSPAATPGKAPACWRGSIVSPRAARPWRRGSSRRRRSQKMRWGWTARRKCLISPDLRMQTRFQAAGIKSLASLPPFIAFSAAVAQRFVEAAPAAENAMGMDSEAQVFDFARFADTDEALKRLESRA